MSNPLYDSLTKQPVNNIVQQFNSFKQNFRGNAKQQIQDMLNSGKISQQQYNEAVRKAQMLKNMLGIR